MIEFWQLNYFAKWELLTTVDGWNNYEDLNENSVNTRICVIYIAHQKDKSDEDIFGGLPGGI